MPKRTDKICSDKLSGTAYHSYGVSFDAILAAVSTL